MCLFNNTFCFFLSSKDFVSLEGFLGDISDDEVRHRKPSSHRVPPGRRKSEKVGIEFYSLRMALLACTTMFCNADLVVYHQLLPWCGRETPSFIPVPFCKSCTSCLFLQFYDAKINVCTVGSQQFQFFLSRSSTQVYNTVGPSISFKICCNSNMANVPNYFGPSSTILTVCDDQNQNMIEHKHVSCTAVNTNS